jgi:hypothetical protein
MTENKNVLRLYLRGELGIQTLLSAIPSTYPNTRHFSLEETKEKLFFIDFKFLYLYKIWLSTSPMISLF